MRYYQFGLTPDTKMVNARQIFSATRDRSRTLINEPDLADALNAVRFMPLDPNVLSTECDIISLHCPLTPETREMVNARRLAMMKPTAILINTGRGPLINEQDLADALNSGKIYAAGVDVLSTEPPCADNPLLTAKNCYITPHIAWATIEARERLMNIAISNLQAYISGKPENVVNK